MTVVPCNLLQENKFHLFGCVNHFVCGNNITVDLQTSNILVEQI